MLDLKLPSGPAFLLIILFVLLGGIGAAYASTTTITTTEISDAEEDNMDKQVDDIKKKVCDSTKCKNSGVCGQGGGCNCSADWEGPTCEKKVPKCTAADCSNNGSPQNEYSPKGSNEKTCNCKCNPGFTGKDCSVSKCPNCLDLSKSKCASDRTCIKNKDKWVCIKGHYLFRGDGTPETMDCLKCPKGSKLLDTIYTGENDMSDCKCLTNDNKPTNSYMDVKKKECVPCNKGWTINSGRTGKVIVTPKDDEGNPIKDWVVINKEKETQNGDLSDCKCNQAKNFYNSENKEYNCIRCFPGSTLKKFDDVELCQCDSPDWRMIFAPPDNNPKGKKIPKCVQNNTCINPIFNPDHKPVSVDFCANKDYFGSDFKDKGDKLNLLAVKNYTEFAHPETGQVKCSLLETPEQKKERLAKEKKQIGVLGDVAKRYLELGEKNKVVNTMIEKVKEHITNKEYNKAEILLKEASMMAKGYNALKGTEKFLWKPYKFKSTGRTETIVPPSGQWPSIKATELKKHSIGRIIFTDNDIELGQLIPGASLELKTLCGTNRKKTIIKIDKVRKAPNTGIIPILGDNLDSVEKKDIKGNHCTFQRVLNPKYETAPMDELSDQNDEITKLLTDVKNMVLQGKEAERLKQQEALEKKQAELIKVDKKTGCIDTKEGSVVEDNEETKCANIEAEGKCNSEFGIINCRKTCGHNTTTCVDEGFVNSWETFGNMNY